MRRASTLLAAASLLLFAAGCSGGSPPPQPYVSTLRARVAAPPPSDAFPRVQFIDASHGWMVGCPAGRPADACRLLGTSDGGHSWSALAQVSDVQSLAFRSARDGWLLGTVGGRFAVYATTDGGRTLHLLARLPSAFRPTSSAGWAAPPMIAALGPQSGYVVTGRRLAITEDGGRSWVIRSAPQGVQDSVTMLSPDTGFAETSEGVDQTIDGGRTWREVFRLPEAMLAPATGPISPGGITVDGGSGYAAFDIANCWAGGCPGVIAASIDGGRHWRLVSGSSQGPIPGWHGPMTGPGGGVVRIQAVGPGQVVVNDMYGLALSRDGGRTWRPMAAPSTQPSGAFSALSYVPGSGLYAVGGYDAGFLIHAARLAGTWEQVYPAPAPVQAIDAVSPHLMYGMGLAWDPFALLRSTNGGASWSVLPSSAPGAGALSFANRRYGACVSWGATEFSVTRDGGRTWRTVLSPPGIAYAVLFPTGRGVALEYGPDGVPKRTIDTFSVGRPMPAPRAGAHLPTEPGHGAGTTDAVAFGTPASGWFLTLQGGRATLWRTGDGGRTWARIPLPASRGGQLTSAWLSAAGAHAVWVAIAPVQAGSDHAELLVSGDGGAHWRRMVLPAGMLPQNPGQQVLSAQSADNAWILTATGLYRTADGGHTWQVAAP